MIEKQLNIDTDIVKQLKAGDESVFQKLFDQYYPRLVNTAFQVLKDETASKDAAQEVFVSLWHNREKLSEKMIFSSYLKRGVINRAINHLKSRRHHMDAGAAPLDYLKTRERQPDQSMEDTELEDVVHQAIDSMPDRCRTIFMLCRIDQRSHKDIAAELGISTKTIENQMSKALKIIRSAIAEYRAISTVVLFTLVAWGNWIFKLLTMHHL